MKVFFEEVRKDFGPLKQTQVDGFTLICARIKALPVQHQAYILATVWHECARTMQPIEEYGKGKSKPYGRIDATTGQAYYGRGYVQLTWRENYEKAQKRLRELGLISQNLSLVYSPAAVMQPDIAAHILVIGMQEGWFTGKRLADFSDYRSMRKIVNGTDKAETIAGYANLFEHALRAQMAADAALQPPLPDVEPPIDVPPPAMTEAQKIATWVLGSLLALIAAAATWVGLGGQQ